VGKELDTELIDLERRIAADEYTITLARAAGGNNRNTVTLEEDLKRRIAETMSRMDALRVRLAETTEPPAASRSARRRRTRSSARSSQTGTGQPTESKARSKPRRAALGPSTAAGDTRESEGIDSAPGPD
jgi:hypothetical protein